MAVKDYWIYQERQNFEPWALYVVKEFDRRKPDATTLDYTLYSENISNATHSISKIGLHYDTVSGYVNAIIEELVEVSQVTADDKAQLEREILRILND